MMKKSSKKMKAALLEQLNAIAKKENEEMVAKYYPKFKKMEGKYFKYKNCYSCPEKKSDYWFKYTKITEINPEDVYDTNGNGVTSRYLGWSFQTDKYGDMTIRTNETGYIHSLEQEITENEFNLAWNKSMESLNNLK